MKEFRVHSAVDTFTPVAAKTSTNEDVTAALPTLLVELIPIDPRDTHSVAWREFSPSDETRALLAVGAVVKLGFQT